jgi:hypothetical protein
MFAFYSPNVNPKVLCGIPGRGDYMLGHAGMYVILRMLAEDESRIRPVVRLAAGTALR